MENVTVTWADGSVMSIEQALSAGKSTEVQKYLAESCKKVKMSFSSKKGTFVTFNPCLGIHKAENKLIALKFVNEMISIFRKNGLTQTSVKAVCDSAGIPFGEPGTTHIYKSLCERMGDSHLITYHQRKGVMFDIKNVNILSIADKISSAPTSPMAKPEVDMKLSEKMTKLFSLIEELQLEGRIEIKVKP